MMERYELPEGWEWKRLGEVSPIDAVHVLPKERPDELYNYVALENIESGAGRLVDFAPVRGASIASNKFRFGLEHVLLGKLRPYLRKVWVPSFDGVCSTDLLPLRPNREAMSREYLALWLRAHWFVEYARTKMTGVKMPRLRTPDIEAAEIPFPPLAEQQRLVARIEEISRRAEEARTLQKEAIEKASALLPAALSQVFSDSEKWNIRSVSEICEKPQYGYTQSATTQAIGPKFLRITDIQNGQVDWQAVPYCQCDNIEKYRLRPGDILFARTGATTGKSYLVGNCPEAIFASYLIRLRTNSEILPHFLWWYFQSPNYWRQIFDGIEVSAQPNMNGKKLAALRVRVPPISEQRRIVADLDGVRAKAEELKRQQQAIQTELDKVIPAVLDGAFRGKL